MTKGITKYGEIDIEAFCKAHLQNALALSPIALARDHIAYEAIVAWRDFAVDPLDLLQSALDKLRTDAMIVVNKIPVEVERGS